MSIRLARIITRLNVGGPAYQATVLGHRLPERGYETLLIAGRCEAHEPQFDRLLADYPCRVVFAQYLQRNVQPWRDWQAFCEVTEILRDFRPDVVHTHTAKAGLIGRLAARRIGAKVILHTFHGHVLEGYFHPLAARWLVRAEQFLAARSDGIITISRQLAEDLAGRFALAPRDRIHVIELGLPLERFLSLPPPGAWRGKLGVGPRAVLLGTLGRLVPVKNHLRMIAAFAGLVREMPQADLHLLIGGTGPLEADLREEIAARDLAARVHLLGLVEDLPAFYADLDLALLSSDNEGTPVTLLEAMAAGRFAVAPAVGGIPDVIGPRTGRLVEPNEPAAYTRALAEVLSAPSLPRLDDADRRAVVQRFSPDRLIDDLDRLYRRLLQAKGA